MRPSRELVVEARALRARARKLRAQAKWILGILYRDYYGVGLVPISFEEARQESARARALAAEVQDHERARAADRLRRRRGLPG
jgi:hypothetical protein